MTLSSAFYISHDSFQHSLKRIKETHDTNIIVPTNRMTHFLYSAKFKCRLSPSHIDRVYNYI